jgi:DNA-binding protein H-NS
MAENEFDLDELDLDELKRLQKDVTKAINDYQERKKREARAAAERAAAELGFTLEELAAAGAVKGKKAKNPPKYRNPEDPTQTWSGRGRKPGWINEAEAAGRDVEDFRIAA